MELLPFYSESYIKRGLRAARSLALNVKAYRSIPKIAIVVTPGVEKRVWCRADLPFYYHGKPLSEERIIPTIDIETTDEANLYRSFSELVEDNFLLQARPNNKFCSILTQIQSQNPIEF